MPGKVVNGKRESLIDKMLHYNFLLNKYITLKISTYRIYSKVQKAFKLYFLSILRKNALLGIFSPRPKTRNLADKI